MHSRVLANFMVAEGRVEEAGRQGKSKDEMFPGREILCAALVGGREGDSMKYWAFSLL